jgi:pyrimidine-nucleoside phosphorylase
MQPLEIIGRKRDGGEHSPAEIDFLVSAYLGGQVADYQMAAWLMAVCIRGMTRAETLALTEVMVRSGEVLDLSTIAGIKVDKHSTGGWRQVTLIGPPLARRGVKVPSGGRRWPTRDTRQAGVHPRPDRRPHPDRFIKQVLDR